MNDNRTEQRIRDDLNRLAEKAPGRAEVWRRVQAAPSADATTPTRLSRVREGSRARRNLVTTVAAAAVVAAMLLGVNMLMRSSPGSLGGDDRVASSPGVDDGAKIVQDPVEVGRGHAVVSVPGAWGRDAVHCGVATNDTVVFETFGGRGCSAPPSDFSTLTIGPAAGHDTAGIPSRTLDGRSVYVTEPQSLDGFSVIEILVPDDDARFVIRTRQDDLATAIAASLRVLPDTKITVPDIHHGATGGQPGVSDAPGPDEVKARLQRFGLSVQVVFEGAATATHWSALQADAEPGAVVPIGSTITLTFSVDTK